jgi:hypothetical protein
MEHRLVLFDSGIYRERVEPALKDFFAGGAEGAILHLLQETNQRAAENEALRRRLLSMNIEPGQSIIRLLTGFSLDDDFAVMEAGVSRRALEQYVSGAVVYELLAVLCIPNLPGIHPEQPIGDGAFLSHVQEHSAWMGNALTGGLVGKGERLQFALGMQSEALQRPDQERLLAELKALPAPDPRAGNEKRVAELKNKLPRLGTAGLISRVLESQAGRFLEAGAGDSVADQIANLKRMLEASLADPNLTVLFTLRDLGVNVSSNRSRN